MKSPTFDESVPPWGRWANVPHTTTATDEWTVVVLDNGRKILTHGDAYNAGACVHVLDKDDYECQVWDSLEREGDPELVTGAILRNAAGVDVERSGS